MTRIDLFQAQMCSRVHMCTQKARADKLPTCTRSQLTYESRRSRVVDIFWTVSGRKQRSQLVTCSHKSHQHTSRLTFGHWIVFNRDSNRRVRSSDCTLSVTCLTDDWFDVGSNTRLKRNREYKHAVDQLNRFALRLDGPKMPLPASKIGLSDIV
jgi:hypothetical protein